MSKYKLSQKVSQLATLQNKPSLIQYTDIIDKTTNKQYNHKSTNIASKTSRSTVVVQLICVECLKILEHADCQNRKGMRLLYWLWRLLADPIVPTIAAFQSSKETYVFFNLSLCTFPLQLLKNILILDKRLDLHCVQTQHAKAYSSQWTRLTLPPNLET